MNKLNEFGAVGVGWTGGKLRCRENVENFVVLDNVSCLPDLAQGTPYMRPKPLHQAVHAPLGVITLSIPSFAMLIANASFVFKDAGSIQQEEGEVENILRQKIRCAVS